MRIRLLGTAAGGGVPQWNCNCPICQEARSDKGRVLPRTQSCVAITADDRRWFLLNASPDIRPQLQQFPPLWPPAERPRGTVIEAILLTNADLDHTLGLLSLREGGPLLIHATAAVQRSLTEGISMAPILQAFCGLEWIEPPDKLSPLLCRDGSESGLLYQRTALPGKAPRFAQKTTFSGSSAHVVGYRIKDTETGGVLLFLPDVGGIDQELIGILSQCDALLFDGTFWSENEMRERSVGALSASAMGHVPISGDGGSLKVLAQPGPKHKILIHINNTNPILLEDSPERAAVAGAGCTVGADGMEVIV